MIEAIAEVTSNMESMLPMKIKKNAQNKDLKKSGTSQDKNLKPFVAGSQLKHDDKNLYTTKPEEN